MIRHPVIMFGKSGSSTPTGLFSYLRFNDDLVDSVGSFAFAEGGSAMSYETGKSGNALIFSSGTLVDGPTTCEFNFVSGGVDQDFGFSFWIKPSTVQFSDIFIRVNGGAGLGVYRCFITGSNTVRFQMFDGTDNALKRRIDSTTTLSNGTWTHISIFHTGGVLKMYVNGTSEGTVNDVGAYSNMAAFTGGGVILGGPATGNYFLATLDGFGFWNANKNATEALEIYNTQNAGNELA